MTSNKTISKRIALLAAALIALPLLTSPCAAQNADATFGTVTDVIVGRNNKGPYALSWTNIDMDTVTVVINGRTLKKDQEYRIDAAKGMLSFDSTLLKDAIVRVTYKPVPGKSQKTGGQMNIPVTLQLFQRQDASFQVTGLYAQDDPKNPNAGKTVVGVGGEKKWGTGKFDSMFLVSQRTSENGDEEQGSMWERTGLKFNSEANIGGVTITGSYLHSGSEFAGANEYGLGLGKQATNLTAAYSPTKSLSFAAKFQENEDTAGQTAGQRSLVNEQSINYTPSANTKLSLVHSVRESETAAAGSERTVESSQLRLDQSIGAKTSAVAVYENASIEAGGVQDQVRTQTLSINSSALPKVGLRANLTQKHSDVSGDEQGMGVGFSAAPTQKVNVDVDVGTLENDTVGHQTKTDVKVTTTPLPQLAIQTGYSKQDSSKLGDSSRTSLSVQAKPLTQIQLQANLVGSEQNDNEQFQRDFVLSGTPFKNTKLSALLSQKGINSFDDVTKGAAIEVNPLTNTHFSAGYKYVETGATIMTIRDYAATAQPWSCFKFNANLRDRGLSDSIAPDTAALDVALTPTKYFTLTGNYQSNPEDKQGAVQKFRSTALGLRATVGSVSLIGSFMEKDEYQFDRLSDEKRLGIDLPVFGGGMLSTGYKIGRFLDGSELASRTYSLGYRHSIGSDFSLALTGYYTQWLQDQMRLPDRTEYSAEASLGMKF